MTIPIGALDLSRWDEARALVSSLTTFDDLKDVRDKADALRVWAARAGDRTLEIDAVEIRIRAERRCGELMAGYRDSGLIRPGTTQGAAAERPRVTLASLGIDERLGHRCRAYAAIAAEAFDAKLRERRATATRTDARVPVHLEVGPSKAERRATREVELATRQRALPETCYGVILADPEWRFEPYSRETGMDRSAENHYPTSPVEAIAARDVARIAADHSALLLWATVPMLPQALDVMAAWRFAYKSHWVWMKTSPGTGYWNRNAHELLLLGTRGTIPAPAPGTQWPSVVHAPTTVHSAKPERFFEMIEAYFPTLPKIELNRRGPTRPGWDAWGNEAEVGDEVAT